MNSIAGLFPKRNVMNLSHERKFSGNMGYLIPIMVEDVLPGDTWKVNTNVLVRLSPMIAPMMHQCNLFVHFWFVPNRLIWTNWENFITGGENGLDATAAPVMTFSEADRQEGTICDFIGLPMDNGDHTTLTASVLPFRAYNLIWNEWYRDQNLQSKVTISKGDGADSTTYIGLLKRAWEKDYFTSALPWPQKGDAVELPVAGAIANLAFDVDDPARDLVVGARDTNGDIQQSFVTSGGDLVDGGRTNRTVPTGITLPGEIVAEAEQRTLSGDVDVDLSESAVNINELRLAWQIQKFKERSARGGSRYAESTLSHFGVQSPDMRLQRPEFLGGGRSPIVVSEVLQTSETGASTPLGTMGGHGFTAHRSRQFRKSFTEHGWIIGLLSVLPRTAYQQGLPRRFSRATKYDFYWPELANIGEQAVLNKEIYARGNGVALDPDNTLFGYQGRFDEYRFRESSVHGNFKTSLNFWHLGRIFDTAPNLNDSFVQCTASNRVFAVPTEDVLWIQLVNDVKVARPMPLRGEPGLVDHN